jgi:hypothetical protein
VKRTHDPYLGMELIQDVLNDLQVIQGSVYDYYELPDLLGAGRVGIVKGGYSKNSPDFQVAVKIIDLKLIPNRIHYLAQEILALKKVDHP